MVDLSTPADPLALKRQQLLELMLRQKRKSAAESLRTIPRRSAGEPPVLSFGQRRLWFIEQLQPGSSAYNVPGAVRIQGRLDLQVLERCLQEVGIRHETLRTSIRTLGGEPVPVVADQPKLRLMRTDLREVPESGRESEARRLIDAAIHQPFDLARDPLARTLLLRLAEEEHVFLLLMHHAICDVWSIGVFFRNVMALYDAITMGQTSPLPELPVQYSDFAAWQQKLLQGESLRKLQGFWKEQLHDAPFVLDLPIDFPRPPEQTFRGGQVYLELGSRLTEDLRALGAQHEASLYMTLMAALDTFLFLYTGQETLLVGIPVANRNRIELEGLIGLLLNTLVVRADVEADLTFRELLGRVRERALGAFAHQEFPFERLVEDLRVERDMSRNPIYQVMFTFQNVPSSAMVARDLSLTRYEVLEGTSREDLELNLRETGDGLAGWFTYDVGLFDPSTVKRLAGHFLRLLEGVARDPDRRVATYPLLSHAERHALMVEPNDTAPGPEGTFLDLFARQVERTPEATAAVCGTDRLTYAELAARARVLAGHLVRLGVAPGTVVGLLDRRGLDLLTAILGVLEAGGAYLPLDPEHPAPRHAQILGQSGTPLVLASTDLRPVLGEAVTQLATPPRVFSVGELLAGQSGERAPAARPGPEDLAYVIFTSGSTGQPKGAMVTHCGMVNHLLAKIGDLRLSAADAVAQTASQCFDISVWQLLAGLAVGGRIHIYPDEVAHDPARLLASTGVDGITVLETVPSLLRMMIEEAGRSGAPRLEALRWMVPTGEALPPELCSRWFELYPAVPLMNAYGPTECSDDVTHHRMDAPLPSDAVRVPIGCAIVSTRLTVVDRRMRPVPIGVPGELCVGGVGVGRGYLNDPGRTAAVFLPDPFVETPGARQYRTGDLVRRLPDGCLDFLGRIDHQVKVRGFRIELGEIESVLARQPGVLQAVVLAPEAGAAGRSLVAFVVTSTPREAAGRELRELLAARLPEYMIPAAFVYLDALPLTANGKVDRRALLATLDGAFVPRQEYLAPRTPVEESLAAIWAEVLKVPRVGVEDDFFELGGQSLLATQVISRIREGLKIELPVRALFQKPTVAGLAESVEVAMLRAHGLPEAPPMVRLPRDGSDLPLSFAQERLWFIDQLRPGLTAYNIFGAVRMCGALEVPVLERSFSELARRHEVLRTTFQTVAGRPAQRVNPPMAVPIPVVDLRAVPEPARGELAERLGNEEAQRPFDLGTGPLIRGVLLKVNGEDHLLAVTAHHIVYDVWSREILIRELGALYEAFWHGRPSPLPELAVQYADFASWQRQWLQGEVLQTQLDYWLEQLAGVTTGTELPADRARQPVQSFRGARALLQLAPEATGAIQDFSRRHGVTLYMTLLAGFSAFLHRYTGEDDVVMGSPIANRNRAEIEPMIGFFVNTQVLRLRTAGDFRELVGRAREVALGAYSNQDLAFEHLVKAMKPPRDTSRQPLFQVLFNFLTNYRPIHMELPGVRLTPERNHSGAVQFDLVVSMYEADGRLHCSADYATDLYDPSTVDRMIGHFAHLLEAGVADPARPLSEISLWPAEQGQLLLAEWNDTALELPRELFIHETIVAGGVRAPESVAAVSGDGRLTYGDLLGRSEVLARRLRHLGAGPDTLVGLHLERSVDLVVGILGVLRAGAAYLPLDPAYPAERLTYMLRDAEAPLVVTHGRLAGRLVSAGCRELRLDEEASMAQMAAESLEPAALGLSPDNLAYVIYTSGSSGRPKGVQVSHRNLACSTAARLAYYRERVDAFLLLSSFAFDSSVAGIFGTLGQGGKLVVAPGNLQEDVARLGAWIEREEVTHLLCVPSLWALLLDLPGTASLRAVVVAGEACPPELVERHLARRPKTGLWNEYGPTEGTVWSTVHAFPPGGLSGKVPIGRPVANARVHVVDRTGRCVPPGVPGELWVGGAGVTRGYLGRPALTAEKFIPDPFGGEPGARLYRTGDLVRWLAGGEILFLGRIDQQVKVRGYRIELEEIETVLRSFPGVRDAAAAAVDALRRGEGEELSGATAPGVQRLVAWLVVEPGAVEPPAAELRTFLRERLPEYMVPSAFAILKVLPLTPNGKVDRQALSRADGVALAPEAPYVAPRNATEETLATIWADLLQVERVGVHDNFFDLGGHSLLTTQLVSRLRDSFQLEVPLQGFFEEPTVAGLAESIELSLWACQVAEETPAVAVGEGFEEGEI